MGIFKDMLGSDESLFRDTVALDYSFIPKLIPYREKEQFHVAGCIKPLFQKRNGKNVLIHGKPGVGKTVACRHVLKELDEETDEVIPIYINCWQKNTTYKIVMDICENVINYRLTHNKKTDELFKKIKSFLNQTSVVIVLDEVDKLEDNDFLYQVLEEIYRKTIIMITNHKEWLTDLDQRIKSRLMPETLEFKEYNSQEIKGILKDRLKYAFVPGVWNPDAFEIAAKTSSEYGDVRTGLYLLREAGNLAEDDASKKIFKEHVDKAMLKMDDFKTKKTDDIEDDETKMILAIVKENSGKKIGDLYKIFDEKGGGSVYKTFQRKIAKLEENNFISTKKIVGGIDGNTTIVYYSETKKLSDF
ncbi:Cdc6/Cdc18 family protein [Nanoarchaeota archaeon]